MKSTLICTVYNEEKTIVRLLESIRDQTKVPDEIIFLDSLSTDTTSNIIKVYQSDNKRIKLMERKADIGTARNILIKKAKNEIILVTDGGCFLDKNWCKEMLKPFYNPKTDVVGGVYEPWAKNFFEKCQGAIVCKPIEKIDKNRFLPSSRSLAFRKKVWKDIHGYPPHEIGGEDTKFVLDIKRKGYKIVINKKAIVYWRMRSPLRNFMKQFSMYAMGDVRSGNFTRMRTTIILSIFFPMYLSVLVLSLLSALIVLYDVGFFRSFQFLPLEIFLVLFTIPVPYFLYQGIKVAKSVRDIRGVYYGFLFSFLKRFMYFSGIWIELLFPNRIKYKNENY